MTRNTVKIIGAGLAGSEACWQLAKRGFDVELWEMRPEKMTPAHSTGNFAELVCSNSLKSASLSNACGLLKEEMRRLDSIIMEAADATGFASGAALAVDREKFSAYVTERITALPNVRIVTKEYTNEVLEPYTIVAAGPLCSDKLFETLGTSLGQGFRNFFDASAPIIDADSIDRSLCFEGSRYGEGGDDYINCPMTEAEYSAFVNALLSAETAEVHGFEKNMVFEGCMPVEVMCQRGFETLRCGPLKPQGITLPNGTKPYAVVQLRAENTDKTMYNMVGFQTHLKFPEQRRVFSMIPALHDAKFLRYGVMHRNTYVDSPRLLDNCYSLKKNPTIFIAGQISGVEGYVESAASGLSAGLLFASRMLGHESKLPKETMIGALASYVSNPGVVNFQPMNANYGIIPKIFENIPKQEKGERYARRAFEKLDEFISASPWLFE